MSTSERTAPPLLTFQARPPSRGGAVRREHLHLIRELAGAQLKAKDQSTIVGLGWSLLHPLLMLALLYLFFSGRIGRDIPHYSIFLLIGIVHYTHFANSTSAAVNVLATMRHLTCETIFPKTALVIASVIANAAEFIISMGICLVLAVLAGVRLTPTVALLPLVMLVQIWTVLWLSLLLACAYVFTKDIGHVYQVFLRILFFITPTFYSPAFLASGLAQALVLANPLAHFIQFSRALIVEGELFSLGPFLGICAINTLGTYASLRIFRSCEPIFAERL